MADDLLNSQSENTPSDTAIQTEEQIISENPRQTLDSRTEKPPSVNRWKENHGSLILLVFVAIVSIGFILIWYQQTRFVPPRFPESEMIQTVEEITEDGQITLEAQGMIAVRIAGAPNDQGSLKAAIHANPLTFRSEDQALISQSLPIKDGESIWLLPVDRLPPQFAVAAYHDENDDQELTLNRFGIPTERYGFSREARGLAGPPKFEEAVINRPAAGDQIFVFLR